MSFAAEVQELAVRISLDNDLSPGLKKIEGQVAKVNSRLGAFSGALNRNLGKAVDKTISSGVRFLADGIRTGLEDLATLEDATTSVTGAIAQMGLKGQVTADQIAGWANEIEADVEAAFDDKAITRATTTLLRFGKVTPKNLRKTMVVMTDLAAKTGDVDSASTLLAKALADPEKAAGKLARQGIILTKEQQKQIKAMVKAGDVAGAQALLLDAVAKSTKGAAKASAGPYRDALNKLGDAAEDAKKALAIGFLPVIERVADKLQTALADPKVIDNIKKFGTGLANAFDKAIDFAEKVPWDAIASGLKTSAQWAGKLFDAFRSMPPEAQATIIALAGLNKLSGGAISGIVGELGKGLIKGVLGMTAGVVNLKAGVVNGAGGGVGAGAGAAGAGGAIGKVAKVVGGALIVGAVAEIANEIKPLVTGAGIDLHNAIVDAFDIDIKLPIPKPSEMEWPFGPKNTPTILPELFGGNGVLGGTAADTGGSGTHTNLAGGRGGPPVTPAIISAGTKPTKDAVGRAQGVIDSSLQRTRSALHAKLTAVQAAERASAAVFREGERGVKSTVAARSQIEVSRLAHIAAKQKEGTNATNSLKGAVTGKLNTANARLAAIRAKRTVFTTHVNVSTAVSVRNVNNSVTTSNRYGSKTLSQAS